MKWEEVSDKEFAVFMRRRRNATMVYRSVLSEDVVVYHMGAEDARSSGAIWIAKEQERRFYINTDEHRQRIPTS